MSDREQRDEMMALADKWESNAAAVRLISVVTEDGKDWREGMASAFKQAARDLRDALAMAKEVNDE